MLYCCPKFILLIFEAGVFTSSIIIICNFKIIYKLKTLNVKT